MVRVAADRRHGRPFLLSEPSLTSMSLLFSGSTWTPRALTTAIGSWGARIIVRPVRAFADVTSSNPRSPSVSEVVTRSPSHS